MEKTIWVGLFFMALLIGCGETDPTETGPVALDLPLQTLAGEQVNLSDYAGQVILINFWATWCGPCRVEMPEFEAFYQAHQDDGFVILAVNAGEPPSRAQGFIDEGGYTFPVILDPDGDVADYFGGVRLMPTTFVIDQQGELVYQHFGPLDLKVLDTELLPLLQ